MNVVVTVGDVLDAAADVLISTANPWLNMSGGVNGAICEREPAIQFELRDHLESVGESAIPACSVVRTSAGNLPFYTSSTLWQSTRSTIHHLKSFRTHSPTHLGWPFHWALNPFRCQRWPPVTAQ